VCWYEILNATHEKLLQTTNAKAGLFPSMEVRPKAGVVTSVLLPEEVTACFLLRLTGIFPAIKINSHLRAFAQTTE
ncbi:MAG: hypothetical protein LBI31_01460, partial [Zoogloeaceae bacterium]|nr:hypothetical protein [Zoogloeaceae bacterium]